MMWGWYSKLILELALVEEKDCRQPGQLIIVLEVSNVIQLYILSGFFFYEKFHCWIPVLHCSWLSSNLLTCSCPNDVKRCYFIWKDFWNLLWSQPTLICCFKIIRKNRISFCCEPFSETGVNNGIFRPIVSRSLVTSWVVYFIYLCLELVRTYHFSLVPNASCNVKDRYISLKFWQLLLSIYSKSVPMSENSVYCQNDCLVVFEVYDLAL